jgi:hypothetical protein
MVGLSNHQPNGGGEGWFLKTTFLIQSLFSKGMGFLCFTPYDLRLGALCSNEERLKEEQNNMMHY